VLQLLERRIFDISEAICGNGTADNESSFKAAAGVLLRANPFLQAITHVASVGVVSHVPSSPAGPILAQDRTIRDPLRVLSQGVVLSEPFAAETCLLAVLVAIGFAIGRRNPVTLGIWAGIGVGIVALGLTRFANLNKFEI